MKRLSVLLLCPLLLLGCEIVSGTDDSPGPQQFLFEVEHINFAWGTYRAGLYVDNQGHIYHYDFSEDPWTPDNPDRFTEAELQEKYSHNKEQVGAVDQTVLKKMTALILPAGAGPISDPVGRCYDAGVMTYRAYRYDPRAARYTPVLLQVQGDYAQKNFSDSAQSLVAWLKSLDERFNLNFCLP